MTKEEQVKKSKTKPTKWQVYTWLFVIFTVVSMFFHIISGPITYPTAEHRETAARYSELTDPEKYEFNLNDPTGSAEINKIENSDEYSYSFLASIFTGVINLAVWVALIGYGYNYLRKNRIGKNQVKALAVIDAISTVALLYPIEVTSKYLGYPSGIYSIPGFEGWGYVIFISLVVFGFSYLITYLVASIFKWRYERKFDFSINE